MMKIWKYSQFQSNTISSDRKIRSPDDHCHGSKDMAKL
jgi:hypothetical protein